MWTLLLYSWDFSLYNNIFLHSGQYYALALHLMRGLVVCNLRRGLKSAVFRQRAWISHTRA